VNRCPSCRTLVPAGWIACRRCGAALPVVRPNAGNADASVTRAGAIRLARSGAAAGTAVLEPSVQIRLPPTSDTLLPGRTRDNMLPRRRADPARRRTVIVAAVVAVALAVSAWMTARVVFTSASTGDNAPATLTVQDRRAETLLRDAADAARTLFMQAGTYERITTGAVADRAHGIRIVAAGTVARAGTVSIRVSDRDTLILATPGSAKTCVFARDEPTRSQIAFAVARGTPCAATKAPRTGWDS
jgi:hypothetical protein